MKRKIIGSLQAWKDKLGRKPLIIKGPRQVGKTYILKEFGQKYFKNYHYINFELDNDEEIKKIFDKSLEPKTILAEISLKTQRMIDKENDLLIFDEIQFAPKALTALKYFCENMPELRVCAAGSLLGLQLSEDSFPVGKVEYLHMFPMNFEEFLEGIGDNQASELFRNVDFSKSFSDVVHKHFWERLKLYFVVGGLPEVVQTYANNRKDFYQAITQAREVQRNIIDDYISDIAKHSGKVNAMHIERVWKQVPMQLSQTQDGSSPRFKFKDVVPGVRTYSRMVGAIDWLLKAGLIIKVPIVNKSQQPLLAFTKENMFKLFLFDIGILGALARINPDTILNYNFGSYQGFFVENFVLQEFHFIDSGSENLYSWMEGHAEIELLREYGTNIVPYEVKSGQVTRSKSLGSFIDRYNPKYKVVLSANNLQINLEKGLYKVPLYLVNSLDKVLVADSKSRN